MSTTTITTKTDKKKIDNADMKKLEYLSLVAKVCSELQTNVGSGHKVLAEFVTELGRYCDTVQEFDSKLKENGADMPDYFVRTLLTIIHAILPPEKKSGKSSKKDGAASAGGNEKLKALVIKDGKDRVKEIERGIDIEVNEEG